MIKSFCGKHKHTMFVSFQPLEVRQTVCIGPSCGTFLIPSVIIKRMSACKNHRIYWGGPAQYTTSWMVNSPAIYMKSSHLSSLKIIFWKIDWNLILKSSTICIITRSSLASLLFEGLATKHTTANWTIGRFQSKFSIQLRSGYPMHDKPMSREGEGETEVCRLFCMIKIYVKFSCFGHGTKRKSENQK